MNRMAGVFVPVLVTALLVASAPVVQAESPGATGHIEFVVADESSSLVPCRIHVADERGDPQRVPDLPFWHDHFVCPGRATLTLAAGKYSWQIERGPEHERLAGEVTLTAGQERTVAVTLRRIANLNAEGWFGGDLHVHRSASDLPLLMRAEDLNIAQVITWWNQTNPWTDELPKRPLLLVDGDRYYHVMAGEDERGGGALLYFHLDEPIDITKARREVPSSLSFLRAARQASPKLWVDIEKPFWWDVPAWLATGQVDSIGIANNHMCRDRMYADEAWGRPRDAARLPPPLGNGYWTQEIYYHLLNAGLRLPASAGSASGVLPNPVGYNRVYVHCGAKLEYDNWWANLKAGRSFVTNGPLLDVRAGGELPGHVFQARPGGRVKLEIKVSGADRVARLEIVKNGHVSGSTVSALGSPLTAKLDVSIDEPGWFLVRAIAESAQTFRFASTGPFYVQGPDGAVRISRESVQFFVDWLNERVARLASEIEDPSERQEVLADFAPAIEFWNARL